MGWMIMENKKDMTKREVIIRDFNKDEIRLYPISVKKNKHNVKFCDGVVEDNTLIIKIECKDNEYHTLWNNDLNRLNNFEIRDITFVDTFKSETDDDVISVNSTKDFTSVRNIYIEDSNKKGIINVMIELENLNKLRKDIEKCRTAAQ